MTVAEIMKELIKIKDTNRQIVISNVRDTPFAIHSIKEIIDSEEGPVYIRAKRNHD